MPKTTFRPDTHGFAFANAWQFDEVERQLLRDTFARYHTWAIVAGAATFGVLGAVLVPVGVSALRKKLETELAQGYGLCGGMVFAALDHYKAGLPLPRGQGPSDRPASGAPLRGYLWRRQLQSLAKDLPRFLAWLVFLNYAPSRWPFRGGPRWLLSRSSEEWRRLKPLLDAGEPMPIGLVRATEYVFDNHQVLAVGYQQVGPTQTEIRLYDPNYPDQESAIHLEFTAPGPGSELLNLEESRHPARPLRGFFRERYTHSDPASP